MTREASVMVQGEREWRWTGCVWVGRVGRVERVQGGGGPCRCLWEGALWLALPTPEASVAVSSQGAATPSWGCNARLPACGTFLWGLRVW